MIITLFYARLNGNYLCLELQLNGNYDRLQRIAIHNRQESKGSDLKDAIVNAHFNTHIQSGEYIFILRVQRIQH